MAKILFFVTEDWYFWSHRLPLAKAALAQGYEVAIATRVNEHSDKIKEAGLILYPLGMKRRSKNIFTELGSLLEIIFLYRRVKPDIVHHVGLKPILYGAIAARICGIGAVINAWAGLGYLFIAQGKRVGIVRRLMMSFCARLFSSKNTRLIFQNREDGSVFIDKRIIHPKKTVLIRGSGVNTDQFRPRVDSAVNSGRLKVVLVARMLWDKGVGEFVEAVKILKKKGVDCEFILAGDPDPENPAAISEEILQSWHDEGTVNWLGRVEDVVSLLQECHISVLPSYREGLPKSLLESASVGLPLVATDVPGCREVVRQHENGLLVKARDSKTLADAIATLLADEKLRQRMGKRSREIAKAEFSEELIVAQTLALYDDLCQRQGLITPGQI